MKPQRVIVRRDPSAIATCQRALNIGYSVYTGTPFLCGAPMQLVVTRSPIREYEELVVMRCSAGHIFDGRGVLQEEEA